MSDADKLKRCGCLRLKPQLYFYLTDKDRKDIFSLLWMCCIFRLGLKIHRVIGGDVVDEPDVCKGSSS